MNKQRQLIYFRDYYWAFFNKQSGKVKEKIDQVLYLITVAEKIPRSSLIRLKDMTAYLRLELNTVVISIGFSAALIKVTW